MYQQRELDAIDLLQRTKNVLENYLRQREIALLEARCHEGALRLENLQKFSADFFENRKRANSLAMTALDKAIELGDERIAQIALAIIDGEYSKDFFGMMNRIGGIR